MRIFKKYEYLPDNKAKDAKMFMKQAELFF